MAYLDTVGGPLRESAQSFASVAGTAAANKPLVAGPNKELDTLVIADGGLKLGSGAGTAVAATAAELNRASDVSARPIAAGATESVVAATHEGRTVLLDTAAGSVVTLPTPVVVGERYRFLVSVTPTSNFHQVKVGAATDFMAGSVNMLDLDGAAQGAFAADGTADDNIQLNGTTKGGLKGDWLEFEGITSTVWAVKGNLVVPAGSNPADPFSAAV